SCARRGPVSPLSTSLRSCLMNISRSTPATSPPRRKRRPASSRPRVELLEERCLLDVGFRSITGLGNNAEHPEWGATFDASGNPAPLPRLAPAAYVDGSTLVVGNPARPSPRLISDRIVAQTTEERILSARFLSAMIYGWGQFLDHDLDLTRGASPAQRSDISVPNEPNDPFSTAATPPGPGFIAVNRSKTVPGTGASARTPQRQPDETPARMHRPTGS